MKCNKSVSDHTGFYFHTCGRPAKFVVKIRTGEELQLCGIHARHFKNAGFEMRAISKPSNVKLTGGASAGHETEK